MKSMSTRASVAFFIIAGATLPAGCSTDPLPSRSHVDQLILRDAAESLDLATGDLSIPGCDANGLPFARIQGLTPLGDFQGRFSWSYHTDSDGGSAYDLIVATNDQLPDMGRCAEMDGVSIHNLPEGMPLATPTSARVEVARSGKRVSTMGTVELLRMDYGPDGRVDLFGGLLSVTSAGWNLTGCFFATHERAFDCDCFGPC